MQMKFKQNGVRLNGEFYKCGYLLSTQNGERCMCLFGEELPEEAGNNLLGAKVVIPKSDEHFREAFLAWWSHEMQRIRRKIETLKKRIEQDDFELKLFLEEEDRLYKLLKCIG